MKNTSHSKVVYIAHCKPVAQRMPTNLFVTADRAKADEVVAAHASRCSHEHTVTTL